VGIDVLDSYDIDDIERTLYNCCCAGISRQRTCSGCVGSFADIDGAGGIAAKSGVAADGGAANPCAGAGVSTGARSGKGAGSGTGVGSGSGVDG
jgi:hypothetical protein